MLSSCIDFSLLFFCVYLTDNMKSLLCVMPKRALEITLASPSPLTSWVKMFLGRGSVRRPQNFGSVKITVLVSAEATTSWGRPHARFLSKFLVSFTWLLNVKPDGKAGWRQSRLPLAVGPIKKSMLKLSVIQLSWFKIKSHNQEVSCWGKIQL